MKKIVVAGCRYFNDYEMAKSFILECLGNECDEVSFIVGDCRGADSLGKRFAIESGYNIETYPAEWSKYGRAAGPLRNKKMAEACDLVICFWDGISKGSASMIKYANKLGKSVKIKLIE